MRFITSIFLLFITLTSYAQVEISGVVTDAETGEPLIGASIFVKGAPDGTITDLDGSFRILIKKQNPKIEISYTGYQTLELSPSDLDNLDIVLVELVTKDFISICYIEPPKSLSIGPSYDFKNSLVGVNIDYFTPRFLFGKPVRSYANFRMGDNRRLFLETSNEITLSYLNYKGTLSLSLDYDYIKNEYLDFDIIEGVDYRRFAIIPKLSRNRYEMELGYINQKELSFLEGSQHGVVLGLGVNSIARSNVDISGRVELLLDEVQYKLSVNNFFPKIRTSLGLNYMHLEDFKALSVSAQYRFSYY